jgi:hypothetical protein
LHHVVTSSRDDGNDQTHAQSIAAAGTLGGRSPIAARWIFEHREQPPVDVRLVVSTPPAGFGGTWLTGLLILYFFSYRAAIYLVKFHCLLTLGGGF